MTFAHALIVIAAALSIAAVALISLGAWSLYLFIMGAP